MRYFKKSTSYVFIGFFLPIIMVLGLFFFRFYAITGFNLYIIDCGWGQTRGKCIYKYFDECHELKSREQCNKRSVCGWKMACTGIDCGFDIDGNDYYEQCLPKWWKSDRDIEFILTQGKGWN